MKRMFVAALFGLAALLFLDASTARAGHGHGGGGGGGGGGRSMFNGGGGHQWNHSGGSAGGWNKSSGSKWHNNSSHNQWSKNRGKGWQGLDWGGDGDADDATTDQSNASYDAAPQQQDAYYAPQTDVQTTQPAEVQAPANVLPVGVESAAADDDGDQLVLIQNPERNGATVNYVFGSQSTALASGRQRTHTQAGQEIVFDRGGSFGQARYTLKAGTYKFTATTTGWDLRTVND